MSNYQWIENYVPGGHASNMGALLDSAYLTEYGLDSAVQSSLNIVYRRVAPVHCCTGAPKGPCMRVSAHTAQASR